MQQLIWYSIPGGITIVAFLLVQNSTITNATVAGAIVGSPLIGFILHQFSRVIFETFYGYESKRRKIIKTIVQIFADPTSKMTSYVKIAFLAWELTLYSESIPESFREHDRGCWHYILSFWSMCISALIGFGFLLYKFPKGMISIFWLVIYAAVALLFALKAFLTTRSIETQEIAIFHIYRDVFEKTFISLKHEALVRKEKDNHEP